MTTKKDLEKTGRTAYINEAVLAQAPTGLTGTVEFFNLGRWLSDDELEREYHQRGLTPATIDDLIAYDLEHRDRVDKMKFIGTHFKYSKGWCFAAFRRWRDGYCVDVGRPAGFWFDYWWFAGVRKSLALEDESSLAPLSLDGLIIEANGQKYKLIKQ